MTIALPPPPPHFLSLSLTHLPACAAAAVSLRDLRPHGLASHSKPRLAPPVKDPLRAYACTPAISLLSPPRSKPQSAPSLRALKASGHRLVMITGDQAGGGEHTYLIFRGVGASGHTSPSARARERPTSLIKGG